MKTMVITGGNGFIASLVKEAMQSSMEIIPLTRKELDLGDTAAVRSWFNTHDYDYVFHTGAMAQTADCENHPELTHRINVDGTKEIAKACKEKNARLIFISTEQCFNGKTEEGPFTEDTPLCSVTAYGNHKVECEDFITSVLEDYIILRFSWMLGMSRPRRSFHIPMNGKRKKSPYSQLHNFRYFSRVRHLLRKRSRGFLQKRKQYL